MTRPTATDRVFADLRERIVSGRFAAGSQHSIYRLAEQLEVSRTPVREAVLRLADLGLVDIERNRGVRVRGVTAADVREVFELRLLVEVPAAALAARRATPDLVEEMLANVAITDRHAAEASPGPFNEADRAFHAVVASAMANPRLEAEVARLRDAIAARGVSTFGQSRPLSEVAVEHARVARAVADREPEVAAARMADHLERTATLLMAQVDPEAPMPQGWARDVRESMVEGSSMLLTDAVDEGEP